MASAVERLDAAVEDPAVEADRRSGDPLVSEQQVGQHDIEVRGARGQRHFDRYLRIAAAIDRTGEQRRVERDPVVHGDPNAGNASLADVAGGVTRGDGVAGDAPASGLARLDVDAPFEAGARPVPEDV